ncbi:MULTISPECIES: hypothetical protein [unclassified Rhizobium]|uniref:hypothetical protein n=1 Tax=unclassified Rhizobium TaxID=2613769 RepID=UPI0006F4CA0D|nr:MULTISPECIES: hypothetical protein [unclassified Rhizobium]KQV37673.1 hypothetical protein ASC86_23920 [Rhizobium sp. Root1212]KRD34575.1 hypothetical protein ASE37_22490 [Rhizobium sp. Root268]
MTGTIVSFEEKRLERMDSTLFGVSDEEVEMTAIVSRMQFCDAERKLVGEYLCVVDGGEVLLKPDDGDAPELPLIHIGDLLSNYARLLDEEHGHLEYRRQQLQNP